MSPSKFLKYAVLVPAYLVVATVVQASSTGSDNAASSGYSGGWNNGTNGGTGFQAWDLTNQNNNGSTIFAGYFLGDSTSVTGTSPASNINTSGTAFGIYANPGTAFATASRAFAGGALGVGQTFSLTLQLNFRNGNKGFDLLSGGTGGTNLFNLNVGNNTYAVNNAFTGNGDLYGDTYSAFTIFTLSFLQTSATTGNWSVTRSGDLGLTGTQTGVASGTYNGDPDTFKLYNAGTDDGSNQNNLFANSFSIVPEPSSISLILAAIGFGSLFLGRWKRI